MKLFLKAVLALGLILIIPFTNFSQEFKKDDKINIGFVLDGEHQVFNELVSMIQYESDLLLGTKYKKLKFPQEYLKRCGWQVEVINQSIDQLLSDTKVDIIIGIGTTTSSLMLQKAPFDKPVLSIGIINPQFQKVPITDNNTSGVKNFNYTTLPFSPERDMEIFQKIFPFKHIGILLNENVIKTIPPNENVSEYFIPIMDKLNLEFHVITIGSNIEEDVNNIPEVVDAVYLGTFFNLPDSDLSRMLNIINSKKLPSFAMGGRSFVEAGALASISADNVLERQSRRIALNLEKIFEEEDVSDLPVLMTYDENLVLNMQTMHEIDFFPKWGILSDAEVIYKDEIAEAQIMDIYAVIQQALQFNYDLIIANNNVLANAKEINIAKSALLPQLDVYANGIMVDRESAENSFGNQPEKMALAGANFNQLVYSDMSYANVYIQKQLQESEEYVYDQVELDVVLQASTSYLNVLQTMTLEAIYLENLNLSRKNLDIARMREKTGYLSPSDVYRWESEIATSKMNVIEAGANREQVEYSLKQIINFPLTETILTQDIGLDDTIINFNHVRINKFYDNPTTTLVFRDFLVEYALRNLPELQQINAIIAAQERFLVANKRTHYIPNIGFQANTDYIFYRGGAGSDIQPADIPGFGPIQFAPEPLDFQWNMGISIIQPISQGGKLNALTQQARIILNNLYEQKSDITLKLSQQVLSAFAQARSSYPNIRLSKEAADAADKNLELVQDAYSNGMASIVQLLDAQNAAISARFFAVNTIYQFLIDGLNLQRAMGELFVLNTEDEMEEFYMQLEEYMATH